MFTPPDRNAPPQGHGRPYVQLFSDPPKDPKYSDWQPPGRHPPPEQFHRPNHRLELPTFDGSEAEDWMARHYKKIVHL
ncbi:unnamed protein product [Arabis nemorensis]|uniref:Uncharacterized protein n=1 Tax=Arabis nemorensis TaxID=586526 RepID=A0A565B9E4_9BRAS|nr:unnamed protein product [Arabis nemorensis]